MQTKVGTKTSKHLISLVDISPEEQATMVEDAVSLGACVNHDYPQFLANKVVGIFFSKPSTRTRSAFSVGALRLGAQVVTYKAGDLQLSTGETIEDTGRVLSGYLDALVVRTNGPASEMQALAKQNRMAIVNAMSNVEHPTQAITDLATMQEHFGSLQNLHVLYLGEGNNTASALAWAVANTPNMTITFMTPDGYGLSEDVVTAASVRAAERGSKIQQFHDISMMPTQADVVYTTRWQTMGVSHQEDGWKKQFYPFRVTASLMKQVSHEHTVFMHDLPAVREEDVTSEVLDGSQSIAWRQGEYKMFGGMAVLKWLLT